MGNPVPKSMPFRDIESLLRAAGCKVEEAEGSRVTFFYKGRKWNAHRPHPGKEARGYQIREVRAYLMKIGVK